MRQAQEGIGLSTDGTVDGEIRLTLRLYVAAGAPNSIVAEANLRKHMAGKSVELEIIDVRIGATAAFADGVLVTPTLVRVSPKPQVMLIGNLTQQQALEALLDGS